MDKEVDKLGIEYRCVNCGRFPGECTCDFTRANIGGNKNEV